MSLLSRVIPNLFNGVSQQPASLRHSSQAESVENGYPSIALGLGKRPPTEHVAKLSESQLTGAYVKTLNRDASERYELILTDGAIQVFDLETGVAKTVNYLNGTDYLAATNPDKDFAVVTVADYSFIVNKKRTVKMVDGVFGATTKGANITSLTRLPAVTIDDAWWQPKPMGGTDEVYVATNVAHNLIPGMKIYFYCTSYPSLNGVQTVTRVNFTASGVLAAPNFAFSPVNRGGLSTTVGNRIINQDTGYGPFGHYINFTVTATTDAAHGLAVNNPIKMIGADQATYNGVFNVISVPSATAFQYTSSSYSDVNTATGTIVYEKIEGFKGSKQQFSQLPATGNIAGDTWEIIGEPSSSYDNYFVRWDGVRLLWVESASPSSKPALDPSSMPHKLVREADGTFSFGQLEWDLRLVGDDASNPQPSFVGRTINDVMFYRNRLGFLSDESLVLSRSGNYFNFWAETVTAVLDSDPIDTSAAHQKVSILNWAVPFNKSLMLFSGQTQFQLTSGESLTPKTVKLEPVTEFESSPLAGPVGAGQNLFFALDKGGFTAVREYFVDSNTATNDAADITAHVPKYIPGGVFKLAASSSEDVLLALTLNERNAIYAYKYYWGSEEKLQSAWVKFTFPETDTILNLDLLNTTVYLTIQRADGVYLEKMELQPGQTDGAFNFLIHLDRKVAVTGTYDADTKLTTWTLPYPEAGAIQAVLGSGFGSSSGTLLNVSRPTPTTVTAFGNFAASTVYLGRPYALRYRFSEQFLKDTNNSAVLGGRLQLRKFSVSYDQSGYFRAEVTPLNRETSLYTFTGKVLGATSTILGKPSLHSGRFQFPVMCRSSYATIDLVNDSHLPSFFQSAEWVASYSSGTQKALS